MLKDIEGFSRLILGFSKNPEIDGEAVKVSYRLKNLDLNWLRMIFHVNPDHCDFEIRNVIDDENGNTFRLTKEQYELLKPYSLECITSNFDDYIFFLDSGAGSTEKWDWRSGYPIQIKNAINKIKPYISKISKKPSYTKQGKITYLNNKPDFVENYHQYQPVAEQLDQSHWEEFYSYIQGNYPFNELSIYRIDWDNVRNHKRLLWEHAVANHNNVKDFLEDTCLNKFKEIVIAYGPKEPVVLINREHIYNVEAWFENDWGACFLIGAKRDKYGIIQLVNESFVEVTCGDYLTAPF